MRQQAWYRWPWNMAEAAWNSSAIPGSRRLITSWLLHDSSERRTESSPWRAIRSWAKEGAAAKAARAAAQMTTAFMLTPRLHELSASSVRDETEGLRYVEAMVGPTSKTTCR